METDGSPRSYLDWATRGKAAIWRYALAVCLSLAVWFLGGIPLALLIGLWQPDEATLAILLQYSFLPCFIAVLLVTRLLLGRPAYSVFTPQWPPRLRQYGTGIIIGLVIGGVMMLLDMPFSQTDFVGWDAEVALGAPLILALLVALVIQTGFEEMLFRGLLMQMTRRITGWLPVVIGGQAVLFALLHFGNVSEWRGIGLVSVLPYFITALTWGWVAWRSGSLLLTAGLHFANNASNILLVGTRGDIVKPYAPLVMDMPSMPHAMILIFLQCGLTLIMVELLARQHGTVWLANSRN